MTSTFKIFSIARFLRLGILAFSTLVAVACGGGAGTVGIATGTSLYTSAPSAITLASGSASYTIGGGTAIYKSSSSNTNIVTTNVKGTTLNIVSVTAGTAQVTVTDAVGASVVIAVTVGSGVTATALFTTAPSAVTLAANITSSFTIGGGKPGYLVSSSNTAVATVAINGNSFIVKGIAAGSAQIAVFDSTGTSVAINVTVGSGGVTTMFYTTAASAISVANNVESTFKLGGGTAPYTATSSNASVATTSVSGTVLSIKGIATGTAQILAFDATGASVTVAVTVGSSVGSSALFTAAPSAVTLAISELGTYTVGGGTAPYIATSSNGSIASAAISGSKLTINGLASGVAQVLVFDSTGTSVTIALTVGSSTGTSTALYTTSASAVTMAVGVASTYAIGGGTPPYVATSSNKSVATVSISGNTLTVNAIGSGTTQVLIFDSTGTSVTSAVTVGSGGSNTALYTTSASAVTMAIGVTSTYAVGGGTPPYVATSSNNSVATVSLNGTTLTVNGIGSGTTQVLVFDATGTSVTSAVTVSSGGNNTALYTTSASAITLASGATSTYTIGGGSAPYTVSSNHTGVATASVSGATLSINGVAAGTAQVLVFDAMGANVSIDVTTSQTGGLAIDVQPNGATGNVGDVLQFLVSGGSPAYTVTVNNVSIATVTPTSVITSGGSFSATLLNAGSTIVTIVDALGQTKSFVLTVSQLSTSLRLSPSALLIGEDSIAPIVLNIYGGTAPYRAFTSDQTLSAVSTSGATLTVAIGTNLGRCINPIDTSGVRVPNGTFDVTITVLDSLGASATSIMTIKDNGVGTGSIAPGAPPCM